MAKVTHAEMEQRIAHVAGLLLDGRTRSYIIKYARTTWDVGSSATDKYIHRASAEITEAARATTEMTSAKIQSNLWEIYRKNITSTPALARAALMDIAKISGLDRMDVNIHVERNFKDASDDDLAKAIHG